MESYSIGYSIDKEWIISILYQYQSCSVSVVNQMYRYSRVSYDETCYSVIEIKIKVFIHLMAHFLENFKVLSSGVRST